jgi:hypothetical protein
VGSLGFFLDVSVFQDLSTHYVNFAYEIEIEEAPNLSIQE